MNKDVIAENIELAIMRDSLKIGIFFMDRRFIIQDHYSGYLGAMFSNPDLAGISLLDLLAPQVSQSELRAIKDYFNMVFEGSREQQVLDDINPLTELKYTAPGGSKRKIFEFNFTAIRRANGDDLVLVSVYDITSKIELQKRLQEESLRRHEEMNAVFEFIQIDPGVLDDFIEDMEYELNEINNTLKDHEMSAHEVLVKIYQSVHSIKSNAFALEQNTFGNKVHKIESIIKKLSEQKDVTFTDMLNLTMDIDKLFLLKENFLITREKINAHKSKVNISDENQAQRIFVHSLSQTVKRVSGDLGKDVKLIINHLDYEAIEKHICKVIKDVLVQLIRNSIVHGIEKSGQISLSINVEDDKIHVIYTDNGKGFNFEGIAEKALKLKLINPQDKNKKDKLIKVVFSPGFSTAKKENIHGGRGIGLNFVYDRVHKNNGTIKVKTEPGKGTSFNIFFQDRIKKYPKDRKQIAKAA